LTFFYILSLFPETSQFHNFKVTLRVDVEFLLQTFVVGSSLKQSY